MQRELLVNLLLREDLALQPLPRFRSSMFHNKLAIPPNMLCLRLITIWAIVWLQNRIIASQGICTQRRSSLVQRLRMVLLSSKCMVRWRECMDTHQCKPNK